MTGSDAVGWSQPGLQKRLLSAVKRSGAVSPATRASERRTPVVMPREAALALGAPRWVTIVRVVIPAAGRGITTGLLLSLARVAGETAPLLFTALNNRFWSPGWLQPTASLPVMIFTYAIAPYEDWHRQAWAAGLVLLALVLGTNVLARFLLRSGAVRSA